MIKTTLFHTIHVACSIHFSWFTTEKSMLAVRLLFSLTQLWDACHRNTTVEFSRKKRLHHNPNVGIIRILCNSCFFLSTISKSIFTSHLFTKILLNIQQLFRFINRAERQTYDCVMRLISAFCIRIYLIYFYWYSICFVHDFIRYKHLWQNVLGQTIDVSLFIIIML